MLKQIESHTHIASIDPTHHACGQVRNLDTPDKAELRKFQALKDELGDLTAADARRYHLLRSQAEREILQAADVICTTCVGAGDPRLSNFRFRQVGWDWLECVGAG